MSKLYYEDTANWSYTEYGSLNSLFVKMFNYIDKYKYEAYEALLGINKICEKHNMPLVYVDDGTDIEKDLAHRLIDNLKRDEYGKNL
ncbi:MAG: hypothetical protein IJ224_04085 [Lachnospiraceae bacterium]|nr:hypothetical protein [Lachnospiraceae bacterium]